MERITTPIIARIEFLNVIRMDGIRIAIKPPMIPEKIKNSFISKNFDPENITVKALLMKLQGKHDRTNGHTVIVIKNLQ